MSETNNKIFRIKRRAILVIKKLGHFSRALKISCAYKRRVFFYKKNLKFKKFFK